MPEYKVMRRHERHRVRIPIYVSLAKGFYRKLIPIDSHDISVGGVGFETSRELPLRGRSRLLLSSIDSLPEPALIEGRVVYCNEDPVNQRYRVGVEFTKFIQVTPEQLLACIIDEERRRRH